MDKSITLPEVKAAAEAICKKCGHTLWEEVERGVASRYCPICGNRVYNFTPPPKRNQGAQRRNKWRELPRDPAIMNRVLDLEDQGISQEQIADITECSRHMVMVYLKEGHEEAMDTLKRKDKKGTVRKVLELKRDGFDIAAIADLLDLRMYAVKQLVGGGKA